MPNSFTPIAESCAMLTEALGVAIITGSAFYTVGMAFVCFARKFDRGEIFHQVRQRLGSGILLGLEFLVAADIVHTVAVELTFETVGVLAIVVLIRTLLSFTMEVELTGRWPWQSPYASVMNGGEASPAEAE